MAKDPATLWYWNDWYGGTVTLTRHLKGCYMDLLYAQFNSGRLSLAQIKTILGGDFGLAWPCLQTKFKRDENDNYYNERAEQEKVKRQEFSKRQSERVKKRWGDTAGNTVVLPKENENVNGFGKGVQGETLLESNLFRKPKIPTKNQVLQSFLDQGGTKEMAAAFWSKHDAADWFLNGSPIIRFSSLIPSFIRNWNKNNEKNGESSAPPLSKLN